MAISHLKRTAGVSFALVLGACSAPNVGLFKPETTVQTPTKSDIRPKLRPDAPDQAVAAPLRADTASNVTENEIAQATKPIVRPEQDKGLTIASLGLLDKDGFWLSTPLVKSKVKGRVVVEKTGASVNVILLPNGAAAGSGSQLSIAAMQVLAVPITDLVEMRVFIR